MQSTEKSNSESKQKNNDSSFSFDKCQDMAGMMESCCGSSEDPIDFKKMMQNMFESSSKEEKQN